MISGFAIAAKQVAALRDSATAPRPVVLRPCGWSRRVFAAASPVANPMFPDSRSLRSTGVANVLAGLKVQTKALTTRL